LEAMAVHPPWGCARTSSLLQIIPRVDRPHGQALTCTRSRELRSRRLRMEDRVSLVHCRGIAFGSRFRVSVCSASNNELRSGACCGHDHLRNANLGKRRFGHETSPVSATCTNRYAVLPMPGQRHNAAAIAQNPPALTAAHGTSLWSRKRCPCLTLLMTETLGFRLCPHSYRMPECDLESISTFGACFLVHVSRKR
jgi:hypothetical protein